MRYATRWAAAWVALLASAGGVAPPIEAQDPPRAQYERRRDALQDGDVVGRYQLARWCEEQGLRDEARALYAQVLELDPRHSRARQCLEALGGAPGAAQGEGDPAFPRTPGRHEVQGKGIVDHGGRPVRYWLQIPDGASRARPLPLLICWSFNTQEGRAAVELDHWSGFEGFIASPINVSGGTLDYNISISVEIVENLDRVFAVDRRRILVTDWRTTWVYSHLVARPDLFRFGYSDSTLGYRIPNRPDWMEESQWPRLDGERRSQLRDVHVRMKLTGEDYKQADRGYNPAQAAGVRRFWEGMGVRDATVECYPKGRNFPQPDYNCISPGGDFASEALAWFREKVREDERVQQVRDDYRRRREAVADGGASAFLRLGQWCQTQGMIEEAREAFTSALAADPDNRNARRALDRLPPAPSAPAAPPGAR
ncbi:MAG: tetratricopeptide repeat protein [Planctomycetes bacterium]|nr:tetratricopeptide repeat protein [Planctomycetota bacterium]